MSRQARLVAPGALCNIIVRGIERRNISTDDRDRYDFIDRLCGIVEEMHTGCYAWGKVWDALNL